MLAVAYRMFLANWKREEGQTMAEYGIILAVVAVVAVAAFAALEGGIAGTITNVVSKL
jgi:pilus assembly protein Flp/PilA